MFPKPVKSKIGLIPRNFLRIYFPEGPPLCAAEKSHFFKNLFIHAVTVGHDGIHEDQNTG